MFEEYKAKIRNRFIPIRDREHRTQTIIKNQMGVGSLQEFEPERESYKYYVGQGKNTVESVNPKGAISTSELDSANKLLTDPEVSVERRQHLRGRTKTNLLVKNHPDRLNLARASDDRTPNISAHPDSLQQSTTEGIIRRGQASSSRTELYARQQESPGLTKSAVRIDKREQIQNQINVMQSRIALPVMESVQTLTQKHTLKSRKGHRRNDSEPNTPLKPVKGATNWLETERDQRGSENRREVEEPVSKPKNRLIPLINKLVKNAEKGVKTKLVDIPDMKDELKLSLVSMPGQGSSTKETEPSPNLPKQFRLKRSNTKDLEPKPEKQAPIVFNFEKTVDEGDVLEAKKTKSKIKILSKRDAEKKEADVSKEVGTSLEMIKPSKSRPKEEPVEEAQTYYTAGIIKALSSTNRMSKENRPHYEQCVKALRAMWSMGTDVLYDENYLELIKLRAGSSEALESPNKALTKPLLILDLDETLIHSVQLPEVPCTHETPFIPVLGQKIRFNLRPHTIDFLRNVSKMFTIYLFTASEFKYAEAIMKILDPDTKYVTRIFDRKYCSITKRGFLVKDLRIFQESPLERIFLVDNTFYCFFCNLQAAVPITDFIDDKKDNQLPLLESYLRYLISLPSKALQFNEAHFKLKAHQKCCNVEDVLFLMKP